MNKKAVKSGILGLVFLPFTAVLAVMLCLVWLVMWVKVRLFKLQRKAYTAIGSLLFLRDNVKAPAASTEQQDKPHRDIEACPVRVSIRDALGTWQIVSDKDVNADRETFELTSAGQQAVKTNPDRRLYAVLEPTRAENLKRIENVLLEMDSARLSEVLSNVEKMIRRRYGKGV